MSFRFKKKESVTKAVRRLSCEKLDGAMKILEKGDHFDAVHDVRKDIKKLRAILRLVRAGIGEPAYCEATNSLRNAAHQLNAMRDAQVRLTALEELSKRSNGAIPTDSLPKVENALRKNCRDEEQKLRARVNSVKVILLGVRKNVRSLKVKPNNWKAVGPGLKRIYRRGRKALEAAEHEPSPEHFHEWRKRVKDLASHLRLICPARPRKLKPRKDDLDKLGDLLGDDHDLYMLGQFVARQLKERREKAPFDRLIAERQKELQSEALQLGSSFFAKKPNRFCRIAGDGWKNWRGK